MASKNSRVGKNVRNNNPTSYALGRYVPGNCGATWKTGRRKGGSRPLDFRVRTKVGNHSYVYRSL